MVFVTGDTHGRLDLDKVIYFDDRKLTQNDYLVILGDFGNVWNNLESDEEKTILDSLNNYKCKILFVDGNHDNHKKLATYPVIKWNGGTVHKIRNNVLHLMRGEIFNLNDQSYFVMGGAKSTDKYRRVKNVSWWEEELPSKDEYAYAIQNLKNHNWNVDYVLTHCCSSRTQYKIDPLFKRDELTDWFNDIEAQLKFKKWYFGHYHEDWEIDNNHQCLYNQIILVS